MIPKRAIELAIKGGWSAYPSEQIIKAYFALDHCDFCYIALDPSFWQALVKNRHDFSDLTKNEKTWFTEAHRFYDLVLQGQDTTQFWDQFLVR